MEKQHHKIECVRCGETRMEFLSEDEVGMLIDAVGPIYRQCNGCERTTGWISSTKSLTVSVQSSNDPAVDNQPIKGQERMATQAERDKVNSMVSDNPQGPWH